MQLSYTKDEILSNHAFSRPHVEAGYRLHGGFDAQDRYISPRMFCRGPAIVAWSEALTTRGAPLVDPSKALYAREHFPNVAQQKFLLELGLGRTLWDSLTVTGVIEARGRRLAEATAPDFQSIVEEDICETATGHLNKGLLIAHGFDEGGDPARGEGGHDAMWFAVRDLLFGRDAYPLPEVPESLSRPEIGRLMPQIAKDYEDWILLLMNVLMIEVRAERFFAFCTAVMRDPGTFTDRKDDALHAADLVDRIRQDEAPHVGYLTAVVSELRGLTFKTVEDGRVSGAAMIDPVWRGMVQWHAVTNADFQRQQARKELSDMLNARPDGRDAIHRMDMLERKEAA